MSRTVSLNYYLRARALRDSLVRFIPALEARQERLGHLKQGVLGPGVEVVHGGAVEHRRELPERVPRAAALAEEDLGKHGERVSDHRKVPGTLFKTGNVPKIQLNTLVQPKPVATAEREQPQCFYKLLYLRI